MLPANRKHVYAVAAWGIGVSAAVAAASLIKFPPLVAASVMLGAAMSVANVYSIVMVVEALSAAALAGGAPTGAGKAVAGVIHVFKLIVITAVLVALVYFKLANLFGLLAGFTVVLVAHVMLGLRLFAEGADGKA